MALEAQFIRGEGDFREAILANRRHEAASCCMSVRYGGFLSTYHFGKIHSGLAYQLSRLSAL